MLNFTFEFGRRVRVNSIELSWFAHRRHGWSPDHSVALPKPKEAGRGFALAYDHLASCERLAGRGDCAGEASSRPEVRGPLIATGRKTASASVRYGEQW
jgi:hypothetical protein